MPSRTSAVIVVAALVLVGCGNDDDPTPAAQASTQTERAPVQPVSQMAFDSCRTALEESLTDLTSEAEAARLLKESVYLEDGADGPELYASSLSRPRVMLEPVFDFTYCVLAATDAPPKAVAKFEASDSGAASWREVSFVWDVRDDLNGFSGGPVTLDAAFFFKTS